MKKIFLMTFILLKSILSYGAVSISPVDYDINLLNETYKVFTLRNVGEVEATYVVELDRNHDLGKYVSYKKEVFKLLPGEKKEIILKIDINEKKLLNQEYRSKLYILEKQKTKNMTYETNTILNLYGYAGELKEEIILKSFEKKGDILVGEIENSSLRKVDVIFKLIDETGSIILTKKIRILKDKKFNLFELGLMSELNRAKKIILESRDTKIEREI